MNQFGGAFHPWQSRRQFQAQHHVVAELIAEQPACFRHQLIDVARFFLRRRPAEAEHGLHNAGALLDHGFNSVCACPDFLLVVQIGFDDLGGAFDDGKDAVEIMRDAGGERAERPHLLAMQQFLVRPLQFLRALGDDAFHFRVAADQAQVAVHCQPGQKTDDDRPAHSDRQHTRLAKPGNDGGKLVNLRFRLFIPIPVRRADRETMFACRQIGERDGGSRREWRPWPFIEPMREQQPIGRSVIPFVPSMKAQHGNVGGIDLVRVFRQRHR